MFKHLLNVPIGNGQYRVYKRYNYHYRKNDVLHRITIPVGFTYEVSIPRWLWSIANITPDGPIRTAAALHDLIYLHKGVLPEGLHMFQDDKGMWHDCTGKPWSRLDADKLFLKVMKEGGVGETDRERAYKAVRWFGWYYWRN